MLEREPWTEVTTERVAQQLTTPELAYLADISRAHMYRLENGTTKPSRLTIVKLARALGVRPKQITPQREPTCKSAAN